MLDRNNSGFSNYLSGKVSRGDLGIELTTLCNKDKDLIFLQIYDVQTQGYSLSTKQEDYFSKTSIAEEAVMMPKTCTSLVFKLDLKKQILKNNGIYLKNKI